MNELYIRKRKMPPGSSTHCYNMNAGPSRVRLALTGSPRPHGFLYSSSLRSAICLISFATHQIRQIIKAANIPTIRAVVVTVFVIACLLSIFLSR